MKRIVNPALVAATFLVLGFAAGRTALAAAGVGPSDEIDWGAIVRPVLDALRGRDFPAASALLLVPLVAVARRYGSRIPGRVGAAIASDWGAALLVFVSAFGATAGAMLIGPAGLSVGLVVAALKVAVVSAGGFSLAKPLLAPLLRWLSGKLPAPFGWVIGLVLGLFDRPGDPVKSAEAAADAAAKASPAPGVEGVIGAPREVE